MTRAHAIGWLLLVAFAVGGLAGCGDAHAVEDRALVIAVGVGPGQQPGQETWTFVVPNVAVTTTSISSLSAGNQVYAVTVAAPSWGAALLAVEDRMSRDVYLGDLSVVALDTRLDTDQATAVMGALNQDGLIPKSFWVTASSGPVTKLLTQPTPQEVIPRYFLMVYFACRTCHPVDWATMGWEWWARRLTPGITPFAPVMTETPTGSRAETLAVYPPGRLPLLMPPEVASGFAYMTGRLAKGVLTGSIDGFHFALQRLRATPSHTLRWEGSRVRVLEHIYVTGFLGAPTPLGTTGPWLARAERWAARRIVGDCLAAVAWADATQTDPFGFTRDAVLTVPTLAQDLAPGQVLWRPLTASVTVVVHLRSAGTVV